MTSRALRLKDWYIDKAHITDSPLQYDHRAGSIGSRAITYPGSTYELWEINMASNRMARTRSHDLVRTSIVLVSWFWLVTWFVMFLDTTRLAEVSPSCAANDACSAVTLEMKGGLCWSQFLIRKYLSSSGSMPPVLYHSFACIRHTFYAHFYTQNEGA